MKKIRILSAVVLLGISMVMISGCNQESSDPGTPPEEIIGAEDPGTEDTDNSSVQAGTGAAYEGELLEGAVSIRIGRDGGTEHNIDMYNNDAVNTMLNYLSDDPLLFPTYTYDEEQGFVGQSVRGNYSRDDEVTIADIHTGELYLFSGGQLRLYFRDLEGANITATPVGYVTDTENLTQAVEDAYESNSGDSWGVDVYFWITKTLE